MSDSEGRSMKSAMASVKSATPVNSAKSLTGSLKGGKAENVKKIKACPYPMIPINVPGPGPAQTVLHPQKDVFVLKVRYLYLLL